MRHLRLRTIVGCIALCALALYALAEIGPPTLSRAVWAVLGLPVPCASAYYRIDIENATRHPIIAVAEILNDRHFEVRSAWAKRQAERTGWRLSNEVLLSPGAARRMTMPSPVEPRLGVILVTVRGAVDNAGSAEARQRVGLYLLSWGQFDGEGRFSKGHEALRVLVQEDDLIQLDLGHDPLEALTVNRVAN